MSKLANDYPLWWDTKVTIYNKYTDPQTQIVKWFRHVIADCFWKYSGDKISIGSTVLETNKTICRIPKDTDFLEAYQWRNLPNDEMQDYFTLGVGDIIIKGEIDDTIDEYVSGKRSSDIIKKYKDLQGCIEVQRVANNTGAGRCQEHYRAEGV